MNKKIIQKIIDLLQKGSKTDISRALGMLDTLLETLPEGDMAHWSPPTLVKVNERVETSVDKSKLPDDIVGLANPAVKTVKKSKSVVPAAFAGMMVDPGNPEFETKGAKVTRRV